MRRWQRQSSTAGGDIASWIDLPRGQLPIATGRFPRCFVNADVGRGGVDVYRSHGVAVNDKRPKRNAAGFRVSSSPTRRRREDNVLAPLKQSEVWLVTGSQHLYGPETLRQVADHSRTIAEALDRSPRVPCRVLFKPVVKTPEEVLGLLGEANASPSCVGLILWMHTFSPAKMWIAGLLALRKPYAHLHTQFNRELPWGTIDMDFMNLNQAAHGDREFGFICTRLRQKRKVVVGHWEEESVHERLDVWMRAACAWADSQRLKLARFGDNMREVAVTEGDKVAAQRQFGYAVNGHGVGDLVARIARATDAEVDRLVKEYSGLYEVKVSKDQMGAVRGQARIELGLRAFLEGGGFSAFTDTFEDLHGLEQLPGLAVQRLMAEGYGFGA